MSVRPFIPWLLAAFVPAILGQVIGASLRAPWVSGTAALFLPIMAVLVSLKVNAPYWEGGVIRRDGDTIATASQRNARLMAWTWGAGALSMLSVYMLSGLRWQHGWQYGLGMLLIATLGYSYSVLLANRESVTRQSRYLTAAALLAAAQGIAAIGGVMILVLSGKVQSPRPDWAANIIFVAGGFAITILSGIALRTWARLSHDDRDGPPGS